ncbi:MAG: EamA family transporter [Ktedonobacteraceae bacterium]|nr:EamA family transporter [Ktedonobacteraceae bacterium]
MTSSFDPINAKSTDITSTINEPIQQPGNRWQDLTHKVPAQFLALLAIVSVQTGAAVGKGLFAAIGPLGTTFLRLGFAAVLLLIIWRPQVRGLTRTQYINVLLFGLILATMNGAFYSAIHFIPLGIAVTLEFVGPLGLALVQSRKVKDIIWALLAVVGILLLAPLGQGGVNIIGAGLALLAGILWAGYILCSARVGRSFSGGRGLALAVAIATIIIAPFGILNGGVALLTPRVLLTGVGIAILSSLIPFSLELEALRRLPSRVFGVLMSIEPAVATLIGFLVLHEAIGLREIIAIALIVTASAGVSLASSIG